MKPIIMNEIREVTVVKDANALLQHGWCVLKIFLKHKNSIDIICYVMGKNVKYCEIVSEKENSKDTSEKTEENKEI